MKKYMVMLAVLSVLAGNAHAGLGDYISDLLGIEAAPAETTASAASMGQETPQELAFWLMGTPTELDNPDAEFSARLGWRNDDTEFGLQFDAIGIHGENHETFGLYALLFAGEILGESYFGYAASIQDENIWYGPVAGTVIDFVVAEVRYRDFAGDSPLDNARDRWQLYAGFRFPF